MYLVKCVLLNTKRHLPAFHRKFAAWKSKSRKSYCFMAAKNFVPNIINKYNFYNNYNSNKYIEVELKTYLLICCTKIPSFHWRSCYI